jgi:predicted negative regulator of RcsB-dependent stress response
VQSTEFLEEGFVGVWQRGFCRRLVLMLSNVKHWIFLLVLIVVPMSSFACLQGFDDAYKAETRLSLATFPIPHGHWVSTRTPGVVNAISYLKGDYENHNFQGSIDYGIYLIYDKQYEAAEKIFREIEERWDRAYESAANLGTILEINGKTEEALKWIKKAIQINPQSHNGSEWLHVKILEAKLNPNDTVVGTMLTGVDFGAEAIPTTELDSLALAKLQRDLFYQLNERVTFIQPKDQYIAALMFELGNATLALGNKSAALEIYEKAKKYGFDTPLMAKRIATAHSRSPIPPPKPHHVDTIPDIPYDCPVGEPGWNPESIEKPFPWGALMLGCAITLTILGGVYWLLARPRG